MFRIIDEFLETAARWLWHYFGPGRMQIISDTFSLSDCLERPRRHFYDVESIRIFVGFELFKELHSRPHRQHRRRK